LCLTLGVSNNTVETLLSLLFPSDTHTHLLQQYKLADNPKDHSNNLQQQTIKRSCYDMQLYFKRTPQMAFSWVFCQYSVLFGVCAHYYSVSTNSAGAGLNELPGTAAIGPQFSGELFSGHPPQQPPL